MEITKIAYEVIFSSLCIIIAAICDAVCDRLRLKWELLPEKDKAGINPKWFSFNPNAKWMPGQIGKTKAYNIILLKAGIKTTWLTDNCNDGWHFFKSLCILHLMIAIDIPLHILAYGLDLIPLWILWNIPFNISLKMK